MARHRRSDHGLGPEGEEGAAAADKLNYMGMLLTCPVQDEDGRFITNDHWSLAKIIHDVLETFDNATLISSYVFEPNIHMVNLLDNMKVKWCAYFNEFPPIYAIAAILDPGVKLEGLTNLLNFYYDQLGVSFDVPYYVNKCKIILERLCEDYGAVIQPQPVGSSMGISRFGILGPILKK
ncbi:Arginine--tRNA ligase [Bienertia sinuspersici]